jgi:hypothetical protein
MKLEKFIYHIASMMYSELEYQEELISETKSADVESLELIRDTLKCLSVYRASLPVLRVCI